MLVTRKEMMERLCNIEYDIETLFTLLDKIEKSLKKIEKGNSKKNETKK